LQAPLRFAEARYRHKDVDHLMIYDAFAHLPLYGLGDLGFMPHEETGKFIAMANTRPGGKLPLNTNGGGLSYMHSGMSGMYALQESVRANARHRARAQVKGAKISVCHGVGGMFAASRHDHFYEREGGPLSLLPLPRLRGEGWGEGFLDRTGLADVRLTRIAR